MRFAAYNWCRADSFLGEQQEVALAAGITFHAVMIKGQKVVCINDTFTPTIRALYQQLPVKDDIYTIREVFLGREKIVKGGDSATVGLLLEELKNPSDPFHQGQQELGFSSERFAPLEELPDEQVAAEEVVHAGAWAPA
jgi:hypothetical protein